MGQRLSIAPSTLPPDKDDTPRMTLPISLSKPRQICIFRSSVWSSGLLVPKFRSSPCGRSLGGRLAMTDRRHSPQRGLSAFRRPPVHRHSEDVQLGTSAPAWKRRGLGVRRVNSAVPVQFAEFLAGRR